MKHYLVSMHGSNQRLKQRQRWSWYWKIKVEDSGDLRWLPEVAGHQHNRPHWLQNRQTTLGRVNLRPWPQFLTTNSLMWMQGCIPGCIPDITKWIFTEHLPMRNKIVLSLTWNSLLKRSEHFLLLPLTPECTNMTNKNSKTFSKNHTYVNLL